MVTTDHPICEGLHETSIHPTQLVAGNSKIGGQRAQGEARRRRSPANTRGPRIPAMLSNCVCERVEVGGFTE